MIRTTAAAVLAAAVVLAPAAGALAQTSANLSATYTACLGRAGRNPVQLGVCAQREIGAQDDRLNKAYKQVMAQLASDPGKRTALRDQERSWLKQRDYQCKLNDQTIDEECIVEKTAVRADELETRVRF